MNVMAGHSRPKDGVASLAYVPAISLGRALPLQAGSPGQPGDDGKRPNDLDSARQLIHRKITAAGALPVESRVGAVASPAQITAHWTQRCLWRAESSGL
jgi:hypothetical protein